MSFQIS